MAVVTVLSTTCTEVATLRLPSMPATSSYRAATSAATMLGNLLNSKQEEDEPKDPQENAAQTQEESFRLLPHENLPKVTAEGSKGAYENRPARPISELTCRIVGRGGRI